MNEASDRYEISCYVGHHQVSYVILNGTTWNLEVKGIDRSKRETSNDGSSVVKLDFIDTRHIPPRLERVLSRMFSERHAQQHSEEEDEDETSSYYDLDEMDYMGDDGEYETRLEALGNVTDDSSSSTNQFSEEQHTSTIIPSSSDRSVKKHIVQKLIKMKANPKADAPQHVTLQELLRRIFLTRLEPKENRNESDATTSQQLSTPSFTTFHFEVSPVTDPAGTTTEKPKTKRIEDLTKIKEGEVLRVDQTPESSIKDELIGDSQEIVKVRNAELQFIIFFY